jgi:redox-sensitive bicupin YhaK (pirin superfamily)
MVQLWVNLPSQGQDDPGGYQGITDAQIPAVALPDGRGHACG